MAEDLIARYQLDISDLKLQVAELQKQYKTLSDAEKKAGKDGEDAFKKTTKASKETSDATKEFTNQLNEIGKSIIAAFAVERIIAFGVESVKAFGEAERNALKLQTAVGVNGGLQQNFDRLLQQSADLQKKTIFSDDAIQSAQTAALQFGLTSEEVEKLIPILTDFASATGQDLNSALGVIISGVNGATRGLKQYGITIADNLTTQERFNSILEQANSKFKNQGELIAGTTLGSVEKLSNAWGDFQESVGQFIASDGKLVNVLTTFTKILNAGGIERARILDEVPNQIKLLEPEINRLYDKIKKGAEDRLIAAGEGLGNINQKSLEIIDATIKSQEKKIADIEAAGKGPLAASLAYLEIFKQVKAKIEAEGAPKIEVPDDYRKATKEQLEELAKNNNKFAQDELDRRKEVEKKKIEESKKAAEESKKALLELQKFNVDATQKELLTAAKTEEEKLRIQREGELKRAAELFAAAGGTQSKEAVTAFNEARLAIETRYDELIKEAKLKSISDTFSEQQKLNEENSKQDLENTIQNIDAGANQQILALKEAYLAKGDFSKEAEKKLQSDITAIQNDAERKRVEEAYKFEKQKIENAKQLAIQEAFQKSVTTSGLVGFQLLQNKKLYSDINKIQTESNEKNIANENKFAAELAKIGLKIVDGQIVAANEETGNFISKNEEKIRAAQQTASAIIDVFNSVVEGQITAKQNELNALNESYNQEEQQLKESYDRRLIGAGDFEKEQNRIKQQRIQSEKKIQDEIKKLQRQEDIANRLRAVFEITINTAIGISRLIGKTGAAFLIPAAALLGAAQIAAVLATPLPKYAKGTKYLKRDGNPIGEDTIPIMANEGERIIPTKQNLKYWKIYEALDENNWNQFVQRNYIAPALKSQLNEYKKQESNSFAENVSRSLIFNHDLLATKIGAEIEWRNRNGIKIKGMDDLLSALTKQQDIRKR